MFGVRRFWALFMARNKEFYRDRAGFGWNVLFPLLIILGFGAMFQRGGGEEFKIGLIDSDKPAVEAVSMDEFAAELPPGLKENRLIKLIPFASPDDGFEKLKHHKIELLLQVGTKPLKYWISETSPKGRIAESLLVDKTVSDTARNAAVSKEIVSGPRIDYIDWLFPGILAMNMMFSALYGVGWVIVRYRKNGVLKRLKATPLTAFEYLTSQIASRLIVIVGTGAFVYALSAVLYGFTNHGSFWSLLFIFSLGTVCMVSISLIIAARSASEEFAGGVLNIIAWPMMFLSEVWFSLEGSPEWVRFAANLLPLSHVTRSMRRIINEGASIFDLLPEVGILAAVTVVFLFLGSKTFKWVKE